MNTNTNRNTTTHIILVPHADRQDPAEVGLVVGPLPSRLQLPPGATIQPIPEGIPLSVSRLRVAHHGYAHPVEDAGVNFLRQWATSIGASFRVFRPVESTLEHTGGRGA